MMLIFHLIIKMLKNLILKVDLNRFIKINSFAMRFLFSQNGLQVYDLFIFSFKLFEA